MKSDAQLVATQMSRMEQLETTTPKVLLTDTSRWSVGARLGIAFSKAGCRVSALCPGGHHPLKYARALKQIFPYNSLRPLESLRSAIEATAADFIVPCDERGVRHLHELHSRASAAGPSQRHIVALIERSLGPSASFSIVSSRNDLLAIAREEGIRTPDFAAIKNLDDLECWAGKRGIPWLLKADCTCGGAGVEIVRGRVQAREWFRRTARPYPAGRVLKRLIINRDSFWVRPWWKGNRPAIIAQSYVEGRPANCAVACWEGRILAGIAVEVISSVGLTGPATVVRVVESPEMMFAAEKIAARLGLSGFFGLDFMIADQDKKAYLIEMNPRCTTLCHLNLGRGHDMVGALWSKLSGEPLPETLPVTQNGLIAYFPQAWTSNEALLGSSFQDIPSEEPELVHELLRPWPDRTFLYKLGNAFAARSQKS
jgi:ATP-grasp domain